MPLLDKKLFKFSVSLVSRVGNVSLPKSLSVSHRLSNLLASSGQVPEASVAALVSFLILVICVSSLSFFSLSQESGLREDVGEGQGECLQHL